MRRATTVCRLDDTVTSFVPAPLLRRPRSRRFAGRRVWHDGCEIVAHGMAPCERVRCGRQGADVAVMTRRIVVCVSLSQEHDADEIVIALTAETVRAAEDMAALRTSPPAIVRIHEEPGRLRLTATCTIGRMIDADSAHRELAKRFRSRLRTLGVDTRRIVIEYGLAWQEPASSNSTGTAV
jgi:hypothetical protein